MFSSSRIHEIVRTHDRDRYLLAAAMGREGDALLPLFAFNHEVAKTREVVSEPTLGLIRLQWWRDAIEACYSGQSVPHHEVLDGLVPLIKAKNLPRDLFETLLTGREADFQEEPPATTAALIAYLKQTSGALTSLALKAVGEEAEEPCLVDLSVAYGISGLIRSLPYHSAQGRCLVPAALLGQAGIAQADFNKLILKGSSEQGEEEKAVEQVVGVLLAEADRCLLKKPQGRYLKSLQLITRTHLKRIRKLSPQLRDERLQSMPLRLLIRLYLTGRIA